MRKRLPVLRARLLVPWGEVAAASICSAALAGFVMRPVLASPSRRVYGLPSDPLSEVWRLQQFRNGQIGLVGNSVSTMANAPSGVPVRRAIDATQVLYDVPAWLLVHMTGPVLAYNVLIFGGLWLTGLATYGSARALRIGFLGSAIAACLFVLAPVHLVEVELHVALSYAAPLPVLLALGIRTLDNPSPRQGVLLGAGVGACGYLNPYLLLEAGVLVVAVAVVAVAVAVSKPGARRPLARCAAATMVALAVTVAPLAIVLAARHAAISSSATRAAVDVVTFSLRPSDYLDRSTSAYVGLGGLAIAVVGVAVGRASGAARAAIALIGLLGFAFSLRPGTSVLGTHPPMPSRLVYDVIPYYRVFGRLEILVALAVAVLAGLAVDRFALARSAWASAAAAIIGAGLIADVVRTPPPPAGDLGSPDPVAVWLAGGRGVVAEYPLFGFDNYELGRYLFRQLRHGRPLLNGSIDGTFSAKLATAASSLRNSGARAALLRAGARTIVVHPTAARPVGPGFVLVRRFPDGSAGYLLKP